MIANSFYNSKNLHVDENYFYMSNKFFVCTNSSLIHKKIKYDVGINHMCSNNKNNIGNNNNIFLFDQNT